MGDSTDIIVAGRGRAGVAEMGPKKSVALPELSTRLLGKRNCEMEGFRVRTSDLASSRLLRDDADTLPACVMRCRVLVLGDAIGDEDADELRERVVGKATLDVVDLCFAFVAVCV
jgi:hypothetical protein